MPLHARTFQLAKDPEHPQECQDAFQIDAERGIAAVADGVASAIFSGPWARLLTEAVVAEPPDPLNAASFAPWLQAQRQRWSQGIDTSGLAWFQKAKLPLGAFSTLLWVQVLPLEQQDEGAFGAMRLQAFAIGDSCLFQLRAGELVRSFPIQQASEFEADPIVLGSVDLKRDQHMQFLTLDERCYEDDLLVLCTDAIAAWALQLQEAGDEPPWDAFWNMTDEEWAAEVNDLRQQGVMRYDDATLMLLRVTRQAVETAEPEPAPAGSEAAQVVRAEIVDEPRDEPASRQETLAARFKALSERFSHDLQKATEVGRQRAEEGLKLAEDGLKKATEVGLKKAEEGLKMAEEGLKKASEVGARTAEEGLKKAKEAKQSTQSLLRRWFRPREK